MKQAGHFHTNLNAFVCLNSLIQLWTTAIFHCARRVEDQFPTKRDSLADLFQTIKFELDFYKVVVTEDETPSVSRMYPELQVPERESRVIIT